MSSVSACLIVRNEEWNLAACLKSIRPYVHEIVVVDTGSTDGTVEVAKTIADRVEVFTDCNDEDGHIKDFSAARNYAHSLAKHEWVFWCDGDDVVHGAQNIPQLMAQAAGRERVLYMLPYHYAFDENGKCTCLHFRERLLRPNDAYRWQGPVHEVLMPVEPDPVEAIRSDAVWIEHRRDKGGKPADMRRNVRILERYVREGGKEDVRAWFYIGLEYRKLGEVDNAREWLTKYIDATGWADEKCIAQLELAQLELVQGDYPAALTRANEARLSKAWPEPYWVLGKTFYEMAERAVDTDLKRYELSRAAHHFQLGINIHAGKPDTVLFHNPQEIYIAMHFLAPTLANLGQYPEAIRACDIGLSGMPGSESLLHVKRECSNRIAMAQVVALCDQLVQQGGITPGARMVVESALQGTFNVRYKPPPKPEKRPGCLDIVFYTGPAWEDWTPETLEQTGLGGSETMCIEMARRLAERGHAVRVFGQPGVEGTYGGVQYLTHERWGDVECDVLVASRAPAAVDSVTAKLKLLWVHDIHCGAELTRERALKFDWILALSQWHKEFLCRVYHLLDHDRVIVTRNGIDLGVFHEARPGEKVPSRAVYSSSPDRGLALALQVWPRIVEAVPEAELHVFYGFENWEKAAANNPAEAARVKGTKELLERTERVVYHGRVGPNELAAEFRKSGVWLYPTWFSETSCITAMQAQAAGCHVVASAIAALSETVKDGDLYDGGSGTWDDASQYGDQEHQDWIVDKTVQAMTKAPYANEDEWADAFAEQQEIANGFDLEELATDWETMFRERMADVDANPVHRFVEWRDKDWWRRVEQT